MRWSVVAFVAAGAVIAWLVVETRNLAQFAGEQERAAAARARAAAEVVAAAAAAAAAAPAVAVPLPAPTADPDPAAQDPVAYARLRLEVATQQTEIAALKAVVADLQAAARARAGADAAAAARASGPMPEGVRQCLRALQAALRAEGFTGLRFLRAEQLDGGVLTGVEMLEIDPEGIEVAFVSAARMTATLDRASGDFELRFHDGASTVNGQSTALGKDGKAWVLRGVDGRAIEAALPFLVAASGAYPVADARPAKIVGELDPITRRQWLARFERVLADAGTTPAWRVNRLRGLHDGWFRDVELVGTDAKDHVVAGAHCQRLCVEVDPASSTVSLLLQDGVLRRDGVESRITGQGYRVLLPALSTKLATDAMFGMVVTK